MLLPTFPYASLCLLISLPSWFRPCLCSSFVWGMIHVESPDFPPSWSTFFSQEMQLGKAYEMEEVTHVFPCCHCFFLRMFGSCRWCQVFASSMFSVTSAPFSPYIHHSCIYYEWIHEIVGWWHHFPKNCSRNLWESVTFNGALLSFWTTLYSLLERRD